MKKILFSVLTSMVIILYLMPFAAFSSSAATEGYLSYTISNCKATITNCDPSISGNLVIPHILGGYMVEKIGHSAFKDCTELTSVSFPDTITHIADLAFYNCENLTMVALPYNLATIGYSAFGNCIRLATVDIPDNVRIIDDSAFSGCYNLFSVSIPEGVTIINPQTFANCTSLSSISIPKSVVYIYDAAFSYCGNLTDVFYSGTKMDKEEMTIGEFNGSFLDATWHYKNLLGDANGDGEITISDAVMILRVISGEISKDLINEKNADLSGENGIDTADAILVLKQLLDE